MRVCFVAAKPGNNTALDMIRDAEYVLGRLEKTKFEVVTDMKSATLIVVLSYLDNHQEPSKSTEWKSEIEFWWDQIVPSEHRWKTIILVTSDLLKRQFTANCFRGTAMKLGYRTVAVRPQINVLRPSRNPKFFRCLRMAEQLHIISASQTAEA